ncbi:YihY/virulence factor BrkB family protein [Janibacter cremeus]|uniref:Membrane protein n=1 Tax=Janibacter cremeus TaxID=1285192 RepID=A0A852VV20_9MICO|nr:YihY/virulence factor BrkB family protein [Janibacter cremeus]NYF97635.1 membrane protein [Janibacter cremeus]
MATEVPTPETGGDVVVSSELPERAPLRKLPLRHWIFAGKRALKEFTSDGCTDLAAALTYFSVLSIFPAMLALVSILGVVGEPEQTKKTVLDVIGQLTQGNGGKAIETISGPLDQMVNSSAAGIGLVIGLGGALWTASGYVGAFGRALNRVYGVAEGRGFIKLRPARLGITAVLLILAAFSVLAIAVSGDLARVIGETIGLGEAAVTAWNLAKWPVLLLIAIFMTGLLYFATPNVKRPFRWLSPGAALAIIVAIIASIGFFFYVSNFASYNATYGSLAGVIIFLLWLWILNNVLLFGAEFDAELERSRQLRVGEAAEGGLVLPVRDSTKSDAAAKKYEADLEQARSLRIKGLHDYGKSAADLADEEIRRD